MLRYNDYTSVLKNKFQERVQKITVNAGFTCPNRDGKKGWGGCTYCNNQTFTPDYCFSSKTVKEQVLEGISFFNHKYQAQKYIVYFQSYTNTYGSLPSLIALYEEALSHPQVIGIVIGTRPDCITDEMLEYFADLSKSKYVLIEYGVESTDNVTLEFINRGHTYETAVETIIKTSERGIYTGAHIILGLPGESKEKILEHADKLSELPLNVLKMHQLQLVKGTKMATQYAENSSLFHLYSLNEYIDLSIDFLERIRPEISIERFVSQSPKDLLIAPDWGVKNFEFLDKINKRLLDRNTYQGRLCKANKNI